MTNIVEDSGCTFEVLLSRLQHEASVQGDLLPKLNEQVAQVVERIHKVPLEVRASVELPGPTWGTTVRITPTKTGVSLEELWDEELVVEGPQVHRHKRSQMHHDVMKASRELRIWFVENEKNYFEACLLRARGLNSRINVLLGNPSTPKENRFDHDSAVHELIAKARKR